MASSSRNLSIFRRQNRQGRLASLPFSPSSHTVLTLLFESICVVYRKAEPVVPAAAGTRTLTEARKHGRVRQSGRSVEAFASTAMSMAVNTLRAPIA